MDNALNKEPVIFALSLDKVRKCERVIIGEEYQVRRRLEGSIESKVLYDAERPLGEFLFDHEKQLDKDWNLGAIYPLKKALVLSVGYKEYEATAWSFLEEKEEFCDPICIFSAYQCRRWYALNRTMLGAEKNSEQFECQSMGLTRSFKQILWEDEKNYSIDQVMERVEDYVRINGDEKDTKAQTWYPGRRRNAECLIIKDSFIPAIWYYLSRLREWGYCICRCCNCGKIFLATSKHYNLCSEDCRKEKGRQNKREFDARARANKYDMDYKNTSQRMRNRLNGLRKKESISHEQLTQIEAVFKSFRAETIQRKKQIKTHADYNIFVDWLFEQERAFEETCERIE